MSLLFGTIGVCLEGYTKESLHELLEVRKLEDLLDEDCLSNLTPYDENMYLQSGCIGLFKEFATLTVLRGYVQYVTDMDNYLHILCVGLIDPDAANDLVEELHLQGLIKPRFINYATD